MFCKKTYIHRNHREHTRGKQCSESAKEAGALSYMARSMVMATLPHRKTPGNEFVRKNGDFTLSLMAPSHMGLPYGSIPRLLVAWVTTETVRTKQRELIESALRLVREATK